MSRVRRLLMLVSLALGAWTFAVYAAHAEIERSLLARTAGLFALAPHWMRSQPRTLILNGARMILATGQSEQPLSVLLDHLQVSCRQRSGGFHQAARQIARNQAEVPSLLDGVLRVEQGDQGMVACLDLGEDPLSWEAWSERVLRFAERGDLSALGGLRVLRARKYGAGSFFVAVWNDGPLPLLHMFPKEGDAPGIDPPNLPRPAGARRLLSVWQEGAETSVYVYRARRPPEEAFSGYVDALTSRGFALASARPLQSRNRSHAVYLERSGAGLVVLARADGKQTLLSVLPMNGRAAARSLRAE